MITQFKAVLFHSLRRNKQKTPLEEMSKINKQMNNSYKKNKPLHTNISTQHEPLPFYQTFFEMVTVMQRRCSAFDNHPAEICS